MTIPTTLAAQSCCCLPRHTYELLDILEEVGRPLHLVRAAPLYLSPNRRGTDQLPAPHDKG